MLKNNIDIIGEELWRYAKESRSELFLKCISEKLKHTLEMYQEDIQANTDLLYRAESARVLKALVKIKKKDDKESILASLEEELKEKVDCEEEFLNE